MRSIATPTRTLAAALALAGVLLHAPAAQADPFTGISSVWSLLAPRARVSTALTDVYRKQPLDQIETRYAGAPAARPPGPVAPATVAGAQAPASTTRR